MGRTCWTEGSVDWGWPRASWVTVNGNGLVDDQRERFRHHRAHTRAADDLAG